MAKKGGSAKPDYVDRLLGGSAFLSTGTIAKDGLAVTTPNILIDTGACGYLFVSVQFARKLIKLLHLEQYNDFRPRPVGGYQPNSPTDMVDVLLRANLTLQSRTLRDEPMLVVNSIHDMIVGDKWLARHDVLTDSARHRLLFPPEHAPDEAWMKSLNIVLDTSIAAPKRTDPAILEDIRRRDALMNQEDNRRRARDEISVHIARLEAEAVQRGAPLPEAVPERPRITHILSRHDPVVRKVRRENEMERALHAASSEERPPPAPAPTKKASAESGSMPMHGSDQYGTWVRKRGFCGWYK